MNRYEVGVRFPDLELVQRFGKALNVPAAYFFAEDDEIAWLLVAFHRLSIADRRKIVEVARELAS